MTRVAPTVVAALALAGCRSDDPPRAAAHAPPPAACARAHAEKLGVPFVRICPADLPGVITAPLWIAAAPIGCTGGEHETVACPPILALSAAPGPRTLAARSAQLVDDDVAHRTCTLRFGGRLPTTAELAGARDALGLVAVTVRAAAPGAARGHDPVAEWASATPCTTPAAVDPACGVGRVPADAVTEPAWRELLECDATPSDATGALIVRPGEACPAAPTAGAAAPACLLAPPTTGPPHPLALACRPLSAERAVHPEIAPGAALAAFRCVVPDAALAGMQVSP